MGNDHQLYYRLNNAKKFAVSGKYLHAAQLYKSLIEEFPEELEPYFQLAQLYQDQNLKRDAENLLLNFINEHPEKIDVVIFLAQIYLQNAQWEEMVEILQTVTPDEEPASLFLLGYSYFMLEDYEISKRNFENFLNHNCEPELFYESQLYLAKIYVAQKKYNKALQYVEKSEKFYSNYWELKYIYAKIYLNIKMLNHAIENIEACLKMCTVNNKVYKLAGDIYYKSKDYIKSEEYYVRCLNSNEIVDLNLYLNIADVCIKNNKIEEALKYYNSVLKKDSKHNAALKGKNKALMLTKNKNVYDR